MAWDSSCPAPQGDQAPTLRPGEAPQACDRTDYSQQPPNPDLDPLALLRSASPSVVRVDQVSNLPSFMHWMLGDGRSWGQGSGFMIGQDGQDCLIATNDHVVAAVSNLGIRTRDNTLLPATVERRDPTNDLAIIRVRGGEGTGLVCRPLTISNEPLNPRDAALVVGHPLGSRYQFISPAVVRGTGLPADFGLNPTNMPARSSIVLDGQTQGGNSGSVLLNNRGEVAGVVYASNRFTMTVAVPPEHLRTLLRPPGSTAP